jgi:hypothetical protein
MIALLLIAAAAAASPPLDPAKVPDCKNRSPDQVVVCAPSRDHYRIDPSVLQASRELDALPPKPPVTADAATGGGCVGGRGQGCTGDGIPLIAMALVAATAAELAAKGDDWRDAIRIHQDEYRLYKEAEARRAEERKPKILFGIGR